MLVKDVSNVDRIKSKENESVSTAKPSKRIFDVMDTVNVKEPVTVTWTRDEINDRGE